MPAWPDDEYLHLLGQVVYAVAGLEGLLLFDLPGSPNPPDRPTMASLAGETTTALGTQLVALAAKQDDPAWRVYLERGGALLRSVGVRRNHVLHARPATIGGEQMLNRWRPATTRHPETATFPIDKAYLQELVADVVAEQRELQRSRPPRMAT